MNDTNDVIFGGDAREKIIEGLAVLAKAVRHTYGSHTRHTISWQMAGSPKPLSSGYKIISEIRVKDNAQQIGVKLLTSSVELMNKRFGDGATLTALLTHKIAADLAKHPLANLKPRLLARGLEKARDLVLERLKEAKIEIASDEEIFQLATAAANGDENVGQMILEAFKECGRDGIIHVNVHGDPRTKITTSQGIEFNGGLISPQFARHLVNAKVFITTQKITTLQQLLPVLKEAMHDASPLVIIASAVEGEALAALLLNQMQGTIALAAISLPEGGFEDISQATGATVVSSELGAKWHEPCVKVLGTVDEAIMTETHTILMNHRNKKGCRKICTIKVGANTEVEATLLKEKYENSLHAVKVALKEGALLGGGAALFFAGEKLSKEAFSEEEKGGFEIVKRALEDPLRTIIGNLGIDSEVVIGEIRKKGPPHGFNVKTQTVDNLVAAGILDPYLVIASALTYAIDTAKTVLFSETIINK